MACISYQRRSPEAFRALSARPRHRRRCPRPPASPAGRSRVSRLPSPVQLPPGLLQCCCSAAATRLLLDYC